MSTRSLTRVHNGEEGSTVILSMYRQSDGYWDGMGQDLIAFLTDMVITSGISLGSNPKKFANGMDCLAAQLICHFKRGPGEIYIFDADSEQEYNYDIYLQEDNTVKLVGQNRDEVRVLLGEGAKPKYTEIVEFVYPTRDGTALWRKVGLIERDGEYLTGVDLDDTQKFKRFRLDKVVGGAEKVITTKL